jgi:hypothetical protein
MTTLHAGISPDDPRNRGLIDLLRPEDLTPAELQTRIEAIAARVDNAVTKARILERAAKVPTTTFRPPPPMSLAPGAFTASELRYAAHPDYVVVIRRLNAALPRDCLCLFWGRPALVHPETGVVFAVAIGSIGIAARMPAANDVVAQARPRRRSAFDLRPAGPEWTLVDTRDDRWCAAAYASAGQPLRST